MDKTPEKMSYKEDVESFRLWLMNLMEDLTNLTLQMFYTYNFISEVLKDDPLVKGMAAEFEEASMRARLCAEECIDFLISIGEKPARHWLEGPQLPNMDLRAARALHYKFEETVLGALSDLMRKERGGFKQWEAQEVWRLLNYFRASGPDLTPTFGKQNNTAPAESFWIPMDDKDSPSFVGRTDREPISSRDIDEEEATNKSDDVKLSDEKEVHKVTTGNSSTGKVTSGNDKKRITKVSSRGKKKASNKKNDGQDESGNDKKRTTKVLKYEIYEIY